METDTSKIISQTESDLTEEELSRIFFGSENKIVNELSDNTPEQPAISTPKNILIKSIQPFNNPPKVLKRENEEPKRPQGRPLVWTPEKKEQLKKENKDKAKQRHAEKSDKIRLSKLSIQKPITECDVERLVTKTIQTKEEIEKQLTEKRNALKEVLKKNDISFLRKNNKVCNHLYKLHHFSDKGEVVTDCIYCSEQKIMDIYQWDLYLSRNKKKL